LNNPIKTNTMKNCLYVFAVAAMIMACKENKEAGTTDELVAIDTIVPVDTLVPLESEVTATDVVETRAAFDVSAALSFINGYVADKGKLQGLGDIENWITESPYATADYKAAIGKEIKGIIERSEAMPKADIVFGTAHYPKEGFEVESTDEKSGYVVLKGKNGKDYKLTMMLAHVNGKWLVDGCGKVNIPEPRKG
jgi:hypothetical protein